MIRGVTDPRIRASATNAKLTPNELVEFFSIYVKSNTLNVDKKSSHSLSNTHFPKHEHNIHFRKRRFENGCFLCGQPGHKQSNCTKRAKPTPSTSNNDESSQKNDFLHGSNKAEQCSFCKKPGHRIETCFARLKSNHRDTKNVNFCQKSSKGKNSDIVVAVIQGIPVDVLIDSGSSISLISSSLLKYFKGARKSAFRVLRGIGSSEIESTYFVTLQIEFSEITLEVDLHAVSTEFMNTPIIVGTDVLNREGVTYVRTRHQQYLTYKASHIHDIMCISSPTQVSIRTPLSGQDLKQLLDLIDEFSQFFITGTATSTVTTGSMSIKLNSSTPINYRPYRLSYPEILKVREIIRDLLERTSLENLNRHMRAPSY